MDHWQWISCFFKWCTAPYPPPNWTLFISILSPCVWCSYLFHLVRTLHPTANNYLGSKQIGGGLVWWLDTLTNNVLLKCNCLPCHIYIHTNTCDLLKIVTSTNLLIYCLVTVAVAVNVNAFLLLHIHLDHDVIYLWGCYWILLVVCLTWKNYFIATLKSHRE